MGLTAERNATTPGAAGKCLRRKARLVRASKTGPGTPQPAYHLRGRPVYTAEQLARMAPDGQAKTGLGLPPESDRWDRWDG